MTDRTTPLVARLPRGALPRLRRQVATVFMTVILAACVVAAALLVSRASGERDAIERQAENAAQALSFGFDQEVTSVNNLLAGLSKSPAILSGDAKAVYDQLEATPVPNGSHLVLSDLERQIVNTLRPFGTPLPRHSELANYQEQLDRIRDRGWSVSGRMSGLLKGGIVVALSLRLDNADGKMSDFITTVLSEERFHRILADQTVPTGWTKGLYDRKLQPTIGKQKKLGVVPNDAELTEPTDWLPKWDELTDDDHKVSCRLAETYAAFASHIDHHVGRLLDDLEARGVLENTLVIYILGDNGSSAEAGPYGTFNEMAFLDGIPMTTEDIRPKIDEIGGTNAFNHFPSGWAHAMNTPYQWSKIVASHWGGTRVGMMMSWPKRIKAKGEIRKQFHHLIDIAPTVLELAGLPESDFVNRIQQKPMGGTSMAYLFDQPEAEDRRTAQYFEIGCNRGIYHEGWTAVTMHRLPWPDPKEEVGEIEDDEWELYGPDDWTQAHNIADESPEMLRKLQDRFLIEASKYNVVPLDPRQRQRFDARIAGRPDLLNGRTSMTFRSGMTRMNENTVPNVKNTDFTVTAKVELGSEPGNGAIVAQGGKFGGWCFYMKDGVPAYAHNWVGLETFIVRGSEPVRRGTKELAIRFKYDGGGSGKGGNVTLLADGKEVGSGRVERTVPALFSFDDFMDIGQDNGEPVVEDYGPCRATFTGTIDTVTIDVSGESHHDQILKAKYAKQ